MKTINLNEDDSTAGTDCDPQPRQFRADSPYVGERLAAVMGWNAIPTLTPEQRAEFDRKNAEAQADADAFYAARKH